MYVCTWFICFPCVMPVTGAITLSPRPLPAAEAVPEGGRRQLEGEDRRNTLQSWSDDTVMQSLSALCLPFLIMSKLSAVQMGGYATGITHSKSKWVWISTLPIRLFVFQSLGFMSSLFTEISKGWLWGLSVKKHTDLLCFPLTFITKVQVVLDYRSRAKQSNKMEHPLCLKKFSSQTASLQRQMLDVVFFI